MKYRELVAAVFVSLAGSAMAVTPDPLLQGDQRLACEAIVCLSAVGAQPSECSPSLSRYYSIVRRLASDTASARRSFLNQCPTANAADITAASSPVNVPTTPAAYCAAVGTGTGTGVGTTPSSLPVGGTPGPVWPNASCRNSGHAVNAVLDGNTNFFSEVVSNGLRGNSDYFVARLDIAATTTTKGGVTALLGHIEAPSSQRSFRQVVLSKCIGDFDSSDAIIVSDYSAGATGQTAINDTSAKDYMGRATTNITTGTWYVNVRNQSCVGQCDVILVWDRR